MVRRAQRRANARRARGGAAHTWLKKSATECTASANMAPEPVARNAPPFATAMMALHTSAEYTALAPVGTGVFARLSRMPMKYRCRPWSRLLRVRSRCSFTLAIVSIEPHFPRAARTTSIRK